MVKRKRLRKRDIEKALKELMFEPALLSLNKGRIIQPGHCLLRANQKTRRHRAWVVAKWAGPGKYSQAIADAVEPQKFYDEWASYKDGMHYDPDTTHIRSEFMSSGRKCRNCNESCTAYEICTSRKNPVKDINEKLKKKEEIRRAKKEKEKRCNTKTNKEILLSEIVS